MTPPMKQIDVYRLSDGALSRRPDSPPPVTPPDPTRPTGPNYIRYEDLYQPGDTVTQAMARLTEPKIITFPEGRFAQDDFTEGFRTRCINIPKMCKGIIGSGRGTVGGSTGTEFAINASTSTLAEGIPDQGTSIPVQAFILAQVDGTYGFEAANFRVSGTEQGHQYNGLFLFNPGGKVFAHDLLLNGTYGTNGAPPGETMGMVLHSKPGGYQQHEMLRIEADGRRTIGGQPFAAVGFTVQNSVGVTITDCWSHHHRAAQVVIFQSFNTKTYNLKAEALYVRPQAVMQPVAINHERTSGTEHYNPSLHTSTGGVHMTHSNDSWTANYDGTTRSVVNGSLKVANATFNNIWGNGRMFIQSWVPYEIPGGGGDTQRTPPIIVGGTPTQWVHGSETVNIN